MGGHGGALKRTIFLWAKRVGEQWSTHRLSGIAVPPSLAIRHAIADRLVFSKLRAATGGRIKLFVSGSAPLAAEVGRFFYGAGLMTVEGYGLTETSPVLTLNPYDRPKFGTVGKPLPGVQIKIAPDGEILAKGPNVMRGYLGRDDLTQQRVLADLELDGQPRRREGQRADRRGLGAHAQRGVRLAAGVVGELRELRVDVVPGIGVLPDLDELGRDGVVVRQRLPERGQELFVIPDVRHGVHLRFPWPRRR